MSRFVHREALFAIALCTGCEARQPSGRAGATTAAVRTTATVTPSVNPQPLAATPTILTLTQRGGSPRFGLVTRLPSGHTCLTMEGDSLTDSAAVTAVAYNVSESGDSSKTALKALVVGFSRECADSLSMIDGRQYALHSATDAPLGEGIGIVGGIDTLTVSANRTVARFPSDSAHWSFAVCSSREGLHYGVERRSADSIITLWDGYRYLGYDVVPDCRGARDIPRAAEVKTLAAAWRSGRHDEDTAMRLVIARWIQCWNSKDEDDGADSSDAAKAKFPPMSALLEAAGSPGKLSAENLFVLGWLARMREDCFESALPRPAKEISADALRREPSSALFRSLGGAGVPMDISTDSVRAEIHRRFDGRGELYRYLADWLRQQH